MDLARERRGDGADAVKAGSSGKVQPGIGSTVAAQKTSHTMYHQA